MLRYSIAIGVVVLTFLLKTVPLGLGEDHPFVLLPGAVAIAAWYGGRGPGVLATVLVAVGSTYVLLQPAGRLDPTDVVGLVALLAEGTLVTALTVGLRSARVRAEAASEASAAAYRETAFALAVRDELLVLWTQQLRGPMADLESQARAALADLEHEGYVGAATEKLTELVQNAELVGRTTAGWDKDGHASGTAPT